MTLFQGIPSTQAIKLLLYKFITFLFLHLMVTMVVIKVVFLGQILDCWDDMCSLLDTSSMLLLTRVTIAMDLINLLIFYMNFFLNTWQFGIGHLGSIIKMLSVVTFFLRCNRKTKTTRWYLVRDRAGQRHPSGEGNL